MISLISELLPQFNANYIPSVVNVWPVKRASTSLHCHKRTWLYFFTTAHVTYFWTSSMWKYLTVKKTLCKKRMARLSRWKTEHLFYILCFSYVIKNPESISSLLFPSSIIVTFPDQFLEYGVPGPQYTISWPTESITVNLDPWHIPSVSVPPNLNNCFNSTM